MEVYVWEKAGSKDVGHTAIRIGDKVYGYYPTDVDGDGAYTLTDLSNSTGEMHINSLSEFNQIYRGDEITAFSLDIGAKQQKALLNNLNSIARNPGTYSLLGRNCTTVAYDCLRNANVTFWGFGARSPNVFRQVLSDPLHIDNISFKL